MKKIISTNDAPSAIGPYSQATLCKPFLFVSGQLPINPLTGEMAKADIQEQTEQCIKNLVKVIEAAGGDYYDILKTTVYLKDMNDFSLMNEIYSQTFQDNPPARVAVEVSRLPKDALVEIDAIAYIESEKS